MLLLMIKLITSVNVVYSRLVRVRLKKKSVYFIWGYVLLRQYGFTEESIGMEEGGGSFFFSSKIV